VANIAQYIALIAAGWFGWQRPWLFGVIAAVAGLAAWTGWVGIFPDQYMTAGAQRPTFVALVVYFLYQAPVQLLLGFVAGWYGGYLRRRLADQRPAEDRSRKRR
jgi:NhaP-type Na+/H+ or K+/H+ antiporter